MSPEKLWRYDIVIEFGASIQLALLWTCNFSSGYRSVTLSKTHNLKIFRRDSYIYTDKILHVIEKWYALFTLWSSSTNMSEEPAVHLFRLWYPQICPRRRYRIASTSQYACHILLFYLPEILGCLSWAINTLSPMRFSWWVLPDYKAPHSRRS
jgi:hypothetical protein